MHVFRGLLLVGPLMFSLTGCEQIGFPIALAMHSAKALAGSNRDKMPDMASTSHRDGEINVNFYLDPDKMKFCYVDTRQGPIRLETLPGSLTFPISDRDASEGCESFRGDRYAFVAHHAVPPAATAATIKVTGGSAFVVSSTNGGEKTEYSFYLDDGFHMIFD